MKVKEVMKPPVTISTDMSLESAADLMKNKDISSIIITRGNTIIGIVTHEDLVENFGENKTVFGIMSRKVFKIYDGEKITRAIELFNEHNISILPVVNSKEKLVGVIDIKDVFSQSMEDDFLFN